MKDRNRSPNWRGWLAVVAVFVSFVAVTIVVSVDDNGKPRATVTITAKNGKKVEVPKKALDAVESNDAGQHDDLGNESAITPRTLAENDKKASPLAPRIYGAPPDASPSWPGCATRTIRTNYSYRTGYRPAIIVLHLTVSSNVVGWNDVNAIFAFFNISATRASSNFVYDAEGHCIYMVPVTAKAWAQAGFNSATACSYEVVNRGTLGNEPTYVGPVGGTGERNLVRSVRKCASVFHIPLRRGAVSGCNVTRSGVVDHAALGSCGGGHVDVNPYGANCRRGSTGRTSSCVDRIVAVAKHGAPKPITTAQKKRCAELNRIRAYSKKHDLTPALLKRAQAIKTGETKAGLRCLYPPKPHRAELVRR